MDAQLKEPLAGLFAMGIELTVHRKWQIKSIPEKELTDVCSALERLYYLTLSSLVAKPRRPVASAPTTEPTNAAS
jgi:hypothetical protein